MDWFQALALAVLQGLTEFLPISSSAHLILPSQVLGWPDQGLAFDVSVHVGTLLAVVIYFRQDIRSLFVAWLNHVIRRQYTEEAKLAWFIILGTIPAGLCGVLFEHFIEENLRSTSVIAATTILFGILLGLSDCKSRRERGLSALNLKDVLIIGGAQALALIPGTSRSGITMTAALFLGLTREAAARFSFLLSIPLIAAAGLLKGAELLGSGTDAQWAMVGGATLMSFLSAYACIYLFLSFLERIGFTPFVIYRLLLGAILIFLMI